MSPHVSIVIVNWKTPELLAGCLDSLLADRGARTFEIWVVDNASGDHSLEVLKRYPGVHVVANAHNVGFAKACNQVIPRASGKYVFLLNPDTVITEHAVSKLAEYLDASADCAAVGPRVLNPDGSLQLACRRSFPSPAVSFYRLSYLSRLFPGSRSLAAYNLTYADPEQEIDVDALSGSAMMVRKSVIDEVGLLDEDIFMFCEDVDWCWRFKQRGWRVAYFPRAAVYHFHGASSRLRPARAAIDLHKGMEVFYRKHLAHRYSAPFNALVYTAIWLRAGVFATLGLARSLLPTRRAVRVLKK